MRPTPKPRLKPRRRTARAAALAVLSASAAGLLLGAPGSLAFGVHSLQQTHKPRGFHRAVSLQQTHEPRGFHRAVSLQQTHKPRGFHRAVASWYYDYGSTACGFHARHGVANRTLPCGTRVKFRYHGHRVTATVDDRGPYIAGRTWDLSEHTARALHFSGVHPVWAKY